MAFFHHKTLSKYTLALLSTFNNLEVQKLKSDGVTISSSLVPIKFSSREKAYIFNEIETSQLTNGNFNVIPRASLVFNSMTKASERTTSKFNKINTQYQTVNGTDVINYQFNAIPYDFSFTLMILADGMNEASMIGEQIAARFNPFYNLKINEIPLQQEPSTINVLLDGIAFETQEYDEFSSNIVTITCDLTLKGNIYPPITNQAMIKKIEIFNSLWVEDEYSRISRIDAERQLDNTFKSTNYVSFLPNIARQSPEIYAIAGPVDVKAGEYIDLVADFNDPDNLPGELIFIWNIISLDGTLISDIGTLSYSKEFCRFSSITPSNLKIQLIITDIHGNSSLPFYKNITVL